jgi:hypothetical protein
MDNATELKMHHGRIAAARRDLVEFLICFMSEEKVEQAMGMVNGLCAMAHTDGAGFGAVREATAAQLREAKPVAFELEDGTVAYYGV